jgi:TolA-binding protein
MAPAALAPIVPAAPAEAAVTAPAQAAAPVAVAAPAGAEEPVTKLGPHHGATAHATRPTAASATVLTTLPAHAELPLVKEAVKEPASAAKLFGEANQARRSGDIGRASGLYHLLQDQFPGSPEADLSRVTLALLLLDSGDAKGALSGFERYLASGSRGLEAEALVGRARALGRLGRSDQEAVAWREVQRKYPRSIYGRQANERLAALGQP